jgi:hypothetical protein
MRFVWQERDEKIVTTSTSLTFDKLMCRAIKIIIIGFLMIGGIKCILGCCLVLILRKGDWNELTEHPKDRGKDSLNLGEFSPTQGG